MQQYGNTSSKAMGLLVYVASKSGKRINMRKKIRCGNTEVEVVIATSRVQNKLDLQLYMRVLFNCIMLVNVSQDNLNLVPYHYSTS